MVLRHFLRIAGTNVLALGVVLAMACRPSPASSPSPAAAPTPAPSAPETPAAPSAAVAPGQLTVTYLGVSETMVTGRVVLEGRRTRVTNPVVLLPATGKQALARADGYFVLLDVPAGTHTLDVHHPQWGVASVTVEVGSAGKLIGPQSGPGGRLVGRIRLPDGQALSDVQVTTEWDGLTRGASTRVDGSFIFDRIPAGDYELRAERLGLFTVVKKASVADNGQTEIFFELERQPPLIGPRPR